MISAGSLQKGLEVLMMMEDAKKLEDVLKGNESTIKDILTPISSGNISKRDMDIFRTMAGNFAKKGVGIPEKTEIDPSSLARSLMGGGWGIAATAIANGIDEIGNAIAENTRIRSNALADALIAMYASKNPKAVDTWGYNQFEKADIAEAGLQRAKGEQKANIIKGISNATANTLKDLLGIKRSAALMEHYKEHPYNYEELRNQRAWRKFQEGKDK